MTPRDDTQANDMIQPQTDKLDDHHRQQLSAMLDGELLPDQAKFMLRRLEHDGELAACWERWQVCGEVMQIGRAAGRERGWTEVLISVGALSVKTKKKQN